MKQKNNADVSHKVNKKKNVKAKSEIDEFANNFGNQKHWYTELPKYDTEYNKLSDEVMIELKSEAKKCNDSDAATYNIKNAKTNSDYQWMKTVMNKGIVSDKIAAFTVIIQDDPICNLNTIYNLINMVKVGKKKECLAVMETLTELFLNDLLKPNEKLRSFFDQPLAKLQELSSGNHVSRTKYLSMWYFEDQLKEYYTTFVQALSNAAHDTVDATKEKAINSMYKLLAGNPEQEKNLLSHIINKLGDPSQRVASKVIYCLGQLVYHHPNMRFVVMNEIEKLLFRPNISPKAQYYSICFLSQFYLGHEDFDLAKNLIILYFAFFKGCVKKGDVDSRMMSALLMGVNRAYPYAKYNLANMNEHIDTMYKVVHLANFNVSLHALNLLYQISDHNNSINDRFYCALYKKLLDSQVGATTHQAILLNLTFRSLKRDENLSRVKAFIKRLLQVTLFMHPSMACGILFMVSKLIYKKNDLLALEFKRNILIENDDKDDDAKANKDDGNKIETIDVEDVKTEQVKKPEENSEKLTEQEDTKPDLETLDVPEVKSESSSFQLGKPIKSEYNHKPITCYDPYHRNPLYAGGEFCVYSELLELQKHFHPTVALFASKILNSENIHYTGDPLKDFTLMKFLERFSFKNPKKIEDVQKAGINTIFGKRKMYIAPGIKSLSVTSANYLNEGSDRIPVEELFMHTYLQRRNQEIKNSKDKNADDGDDSDGDSVASDEFEEMLSKMGGKNLEEDDELDFMHEVGDSLKNMKGKNDDNSDEDAEGMSDDEGNFDEQGFEGEDFDEEDMGNDFGKEDVDELDENEEGFEDMEDDIDEDDDDDESVIEFGSDDSDGEQMPSKNKKSKKIDKNDLKNIFASADEFASILDEETDLSSGKSNAFINKDNSHKKQLAWEDKRNKWLKGVDSAIGKRKNNFKSKNKFPQKKRPNSSNFGNKNKKRKY